MIGCSVGEIVKTGSTCSVYYFTVKIARHQAGDQGDTVSKNKCEQDSRHRDTVNNNNSV